MRAVVLSDERIIEFLNESFISTWIRNADLRRLRDANGFGGMPPLARTIVRNKWWRGPVDTWIISPELEAIGHVAVNEYLGDNRREDGTLESQNYHLFLVNSLKGKLPGFGNTVLNPEQPSQTILDAFRAAEYGHQDYTVTVIDATAFENGGTLIINLEVGNGKSGGVFHLLGADCKLIFDPDHKYPTRPLFERAIDTVWGDPDEIVQMTHHFERGQFFKLVATAWTSEKGSVNAFRAKISVETN